MKIKKKKLLTIIGLGTILAYNGKEVDSEKFEKIQEMLLNEFGDSKKALEYTEEHFKKLMDEVQIDENE